MAVPCVNYYDNTLPPYYKYSAKRVPLEGVTLNLDTSFLSCCDCDDGCVDKLKCQCWQLTLEGAQIGNPNTPQTEVGYNFKRLNEQVPSGIYECNAMCKCQETCLNRVAQQPLQLKLQVFKTGNRGWGLRCLNDVPKGSFICCYAGHLLTDGQANEPGRSDEYYADLDYIEMVENMKYGYEPDVEEPNEDDDGDDDDGGPNNALRRRSSDGSDDEFDPRAAGFEINSSIKKKYRTRTRTKQAIDGDATANGLTVVTRTADANDDNGNASSGEDEEREAISFMPHASSGDNFDQEDDKKGYKSVRRYFGEDEKAYIMDAKECGNIGRYFNVSFDVRGQFFIYHLINFIFFFF